MTNNHTDEHQQQQHIDQETIVRSLAELFADEEGVPLIDYASTLHQLSQKDDDSFRSLEETITTSDGSVLVEEENIIPSAFRDAHEFWQTFRCLLATTDRQKLSKFELEALKTEIRFQHQKRSIGQKKKTRRKSSVRRRKVGEKDALLSPTTTTRLRVRKVSRVVQDDSSCTDGPYSSRGRSPSSSHRERLPRRASSSGGLRRNSISDLDEAPKSSPARARASSRSKGRTRRLSIGRSPRRVYDSHGGTEDEGEEQVEEVTDSIPDKLSQLYLSTGDVEKIKQVVAARGVVKPKEMTEEKVKGGWLDTPKALISMAIPGGGNSKPSSPGTKSPKAAYKHQHEAVISWIRVAPPSSILKKKSPRRSSTTTTTPATPPTHSRNNSGDLTPHARHLQAIPMGSLYSFKSGYDT